MVRIMKSDLHGWPWRPWAATAAALTLAGCASFSNDGGFDRVVSLTQERTGHTPDYQRSVQQTDLARARIDELLAQPLSADSAVDIALLNHRGLQARLAELGIAEADLVRAGRLRNPGLSFGRLSGGGELEIDRAAIFDVLGLLTLPATQRMEQSRFEQVQLRAAADAIQAANEARRAFFSAVAAQQLLDYSVQVRDAAEASGELARQMQNAGNFSKLEQLRERSFHADAIAAHARAQQQALSERERLLRALGLGAAPSALKLPDRLPDLPTEAMAPQDIEQHALDRRLDIQAAKLQAEARARSLGLSRSTRFINVLDVGYQNQGNSRVPRRDGYTVSVELPLFDFGSTRVARAEALYMQSVHHAAEVASHAQSELREAYAAYQAAYGLARHYRDEVVPLRKQISDEHLLRYNGMLESVFELLADTREQVQGVTGAVEAQRDFWLAQTALQSALAGPATSATSATLAP